MAEKIVGILGGGQLGRMLAASASLLNIKVVILDIGETAPAKQIVSPLSAELAHIDGSFVDREKIRELAAKVDVLTVEIEHVDVDGLEEVENGGRVVVQPSSSTIRLIQDKFVQKRHLHSHGCPVSRFMPVEPSVDSITVAANTLGLPLMLKSRTFAYDGRGNFALNRIEQAEEAIDALGKRRLYAESWVRFEREIAVMVVRSASGEVVSYPAVETVQKDNICHLVFAPLRCRDAKVPSRAQKIAEDAIRTFSGAGIFGVEMFLMKDGEITINEIAPRPHNSGHYTIEGCETSQFENHLRAILGLPLGSTALKVPSAAMLNIIGTSNDNSELSKIRNASLGVRGATVHLYGKAECRKGRKMGHVTVVANSDAEVRERLRPLLRAIPGYESEELERHAPVSAREGHSHPYPLVSIAMGSDSDLATMLPAARILDRFVVPYELSIVSAHRTPDRMLGFARSARARGVRVIIAGAGGAAHLPGMIAAMTSLPVIGVPVKGSCLDGVDSLYSIVQMPRGVPVATVAINNGMNAGLLAVRILGASEPRLGESMEVYMREMEGEVLGKVDRLEEEGWYNYTVKRS